MQHLEIKIENSETSFKNFDRFECQAEL